jgi:hypothetical protein
LEHILYYFSQDSEIHNVSTPGNSSLFDSPTKQLFYGDISVNSIVLTNLIELKSVR